jgi:hypothetical protein
MPENTRKWFKSGLFVLIGASLGFAYYYFIGCSSGTCPITSNPWISTGYGALFGVIFAWDSRKAEKKPE